MKKYELKDPILVWEYGVDDCPYIKVGDPKYSGHWSDRFNDEPVGDYIDSKEGKVKLCDGDFIIKDNVGLYKVSYKYLHENYKEVL